MSSRPFNGRRIKVRLAVMGMALVFALVLAEGSLRLLWTPPSLLTVRAFGPHPYYGLAPLPGVAGVHVTSEYTHRFSHNSQGMRSDHAFTAERPPNIRKRVLFLGDSFTYGLGAADNETFVGRLEHAWPEVEVANGGCNSYGTRQSLAVLDLLGPRFKPDLVVLVFFWNDLYDNLSTDIQYRVAPDGRVQRVDATSKGLDPLAARPTPEVRQRSRYSRLYLGEMWGQTVRGLRFRMIGQSPAQIDTPEKVAHAWTRTDPLLEMMKLRCREIGCDLIIVSLPDHNQINPKAVIRKVTSVQFEVQPHLRDFCLKHDLPFINLQPQMRADWERSGEDFYYYADRHLTPRGNKEVADLLRPQLERALGLK